MLKEVPVFDRPREKAIKYGVNSLSNIELIAILLRTGSKQDNVLDVAKNLMYDIEKLSLLKDMTMTELMKFKGIGKTKAITILASIELGLRVLETSNENTFYTSPEAVFEYFYPKLRLKNKECLYAMYLDVKGQLIKEQLITQGTINSSLMDGKDIFKWGVKLSASAIILVHNHPSGDPTPSLADLKATEKLIQMSKYVDMIILDHIIIGNDFYSMKRSSKLYKLF